MLVVPVYTAESCSKNSHNQQIPGQDIWASLCTGKFGRWDDTVGNPHRAQISQFELSELVLLLKLDKQLPVEQFEATVYQSTVPSPPS